MGGAGGEHQGRYCIGAWSLLNTDPVPSLILESQYVSRSPCIYASNTEKKQKLLAPEIHKQEWTQYFWSCSTCIYASDTGNTQKHLAPEIHQKNGRHFVLQEQERKASKLSRGILHRPRQGEHLELLHII